MSGGGGKRETWYDVLRIAMFGRIKAEKCKFF